jgi:hypothetical protein
VTRHEFVVALWDLALAWPASLTSGPRTAARNAIVNGAETSRHLTGDAGDLVPDDQGAESLEALAAAARRLGLRALVEDAGTANGHVHASRPELEFVVEQRLAGGA